MKLYRLMALLVCMALLGCNPSDTSSSSSGSTTRSSEETDESTTSDSTSNESKSSEEENDATKEIASAAVSVDPYLPSYKPVSGISGEIKSVGSDTMNNMMALWGEGFQKFYPNVRIEIEGKGSSTAPVALINGTANFGPMSRAMKASEQDEFEKKFGYKPTQLPTSIDMLAVFANKDNPIAQTGLSLPQIDAIFSVNRNLGNEKDIRLWGQVGLQGAWANAPISMFGRNAASGTYGYFKKVALGGGDYKNSVKEQPGSAAVIQGVAKNKYAIGYSGIGYKTADVRAVPLAAEDGGEFVPATPEQAYTGDYPLSRYLWLSVNHKPGDKGIGPLYTEFVKYIFSKEGQTEVAKDGYFPVNAELAKKSLAQIGIE